MAKATDDKEIFSFGNLIQILKTNWYWFILSVIICMGLGYAYTKIKSPQYTRTAQVLIKEDDGAAAPSSNNDFGALDLLGKTQNIYNEFAIFQSPDIMVEVVSRLNLNKTFTKIDFLKKKSLYADSIPVDVNLSNLNPEQSVSFTIDIAEDQSFTLSGFRRLGKKVPGDDVHGKFDQMLRTPIGKIGLIKTPGFKSLKLPATIKFSYKDVYNTALDYNKKVVSSIPTNKANVIELKITDPVKKRGDDILRTMIEIYNEKWIEDKNQVAKSTSRFIDDRLAVIESDLGNVDSDISSFKSSNLLPDLEAASKMYMNQAQTANAKILELNNMYHMAQYVKSYLDAQTEHRILPTNSGFESPALAQQINSYNEKVIARDNLASVSSASNPVVVDMDASLTSLRNAIRTSIATQIENLREQIKSQERFEGQAVEQIASNPKQAKYLLSVERQQKVKESLYLYLLQKREENELSMSFAAYNTRVIQKPNGPAAPSSPKEKMILLASFVLGFILPYAIILLKQMMVTTIQSRKDIEGIKIPTLAEIPMYVVHQKRAFLSKFIPGLKKDKNEEARVVVSKGNRNMVNEAFRIARTNLDMMLGKNTGNNVIMTTSFNPGSGKSFISMNLAMVCTFKGKKVAVVDCDLRHGSVSEYVNNPKTGLSEYLSGVITTPESIIVPYPGLSNLSVIPIGKVPPNPTELLETDRMATLIDYLRKDYDYIFIDCPPYDLVADTQIVESLADMTIFVIRMGLLEKAMLPDLEKLYDGKTFKHMTLVVNGTEVTRSRYYHYGKGTHYYGSAQ